MPKKMLSIFLVSFVVLAILIIACRPSDRNKKGFTESEVSEVLATLKGVQPDTYRIILPEFNNGRAVGSKTYGSLPLTEVRRVASQRNINFTETGNVQAVFSPRNADNGGGSGTHTESQSPGTDIGRRIERILTNLDKSQYVLLY